MCVCVCVCVYVHAEERDGSFTFSPLLSFGQSINSDVRSDQCHILEPTELLRVSHIMGTASHDSHIT